MRSVQVGEITKNIKEMCIEANYFLSPDMKKVFDESVKKEESPLGKQILHQLEENLEIYQSWMMRVVILWQALFWRKLTIMRQ